MRSRLKPTFMPLLLAPALLVSAALAQAQSPQQGMQQAPDISGWRASSLYDNGWTARDMLDTAVQAEDGRVIGEVADIIVDRNGNISRLVVEVGGFLELGDQHIGVPWKDVKIGEDMTFVQVPLKEVESGTYSMFGRIPQGEDVAASRTAWRVNELIGDYANLEDVPRYGLVTDVVFNNRGQVQAVVVDPAGPVDGRYAYPFTGFFPAAYGYAVPYRQETIVRIQPFDYAQLGQQSPYSSGQPARSAQARGVSGQAAAGRTVQPPK